MSGRVWATVLVVAVLVTAAITYEYSRPGATAILLSRHSMPAVHVPEQRVVITPQGKLFHLPSCRYIHGKPEMVSAEEAVRRGYTPCPRCLHRALQR